MKTVKVLFIVVLVATIIHLFGMDYPMELTSHDFTKRAWNVSKDMCVVCHLPHNKNANSFFAPLWNHQLTVADFKVFSSGTMNATVGQPDGSSLLCLSCHDGTVALGHYGGVEYAPDKMTGDAVGTDLRNDHPISFVYDKQLALADDDGGLADPTTAPSGLGGTIAEDMLDKNGKLQCTSCHNPHNNKYGKFLIKSNSGSALCLTCHIK